MSKVVSITKKTLPDMKQELTASLEPLLNYFVVCETEDSWMCYHSEIELEKLLFLQKIMNLYIDDTFRQEAEYDE